MVIDCAEIGKAKSDAALISSLAEQTGQCNNGRKINTKGEFVHRILPRVLVFVFPQRSH